jgi:hypothetical protein
LTELECGWGIWSTVQAPDHKNVQNSEHTHK